MKPLTRDNVLQFCLDTWGDEPDYPFAGDDMSAVVRHAQNRKWYLLLMEVPLRSLHLAGEGSMEIMNIKVDPMLLGVLLRREGFLPAYHMNKSQWVTMKLDGSLSMEDAIPLITMSWNMTRKK